MPGKKPTPSASEQLAEILRLQRLIYNKVLSALTPDFAGLRAEVNALKAQMERVMAKQVDIDAKFDAITTAIAGIRKDIDDLKASVVLGEPMSQENFDKLSAIADALGALDAENPATPPTT